MTPTRLALLSPAAGSRQCRASTDLGRGPHVASSLHLHLPISPLPSSLLSLSLPSFFHLSLSLLLSWLFICFILFFSSFSSLKSVPHTINKSTLEKTDKKLSASGGSPDPGKTGRHQHWRGWGATYVPPATPSTPPRRSSTVWSAHPSSPQRECRPVPLCSRHDTDTDIGRWGPWGSSVQGKQGIAHELIFIKANCIFLKQTF